MVNTLDFGMLVDLGFVLLVSLACAKMLLQNDDPRARWKRELLDLHASLKELIGEASNASYSLDRNLLKRQEELQQLLNKLEAVRNDLSQVKTSAPSNAKQVSRGSQTRPAQTQIVELDEDLEQLYDRRTSHSSDLPNPTWLERAGNGTQNPTKAPVNLIDRIEVSRSAKRTGIATLAPQEQQRYRSLDQSALRVAKRLLGQGQEIHIVARKVEMSVADVRIIDKLVRQELGLEPADEAVLTPEALRLEENLAAQLAERQQALNASPTREDRWVIERERALL